MFRHHPASTANCVYGTLRLRQVCRTACWSAPTSWIPSRSTLYLCIRWHGVPIAVCWRSRVPSTVSEEGESTTVRSKCIDLFIPRCRCLSKRRLEPDCIPRGRTCRCKWMYQVIQVNRQRFLSQLPVSVGHPMANTCAPAVWTAS